MANLTSVGLTAGVPSSGTGTVSTLDNLIGGSNAINTANQAVAHTAAPSAVSDGTATNMITDEVGKLIAVGSIRDLKGRQVTTITSSTAETTVVTAVASTFLDLYGLIIENTSATATEISFKDSTAGTVAFKIYVPAGDTRGFVFPES